VNPIVAVQVGGQIYHLCCGEHVQAFNQTLRAREAARIISNSRSRKIEAGSSWTKGIKTVLLMRVNFTDYSKESIAEADAVHLMDQVNSFFQKNSFGLTSLRTTVTSILALPGSIARYSTEPCLPMRAELRPRRVTTRTVTIWIAFSAVTPLGSPKHLSGRKALGLEMLTQVRLAMSLGTTSGCTTPTPG
jgi:hypothetical protein